MNLKPTSQSIVLDVGCGTGMVALALSPWVSKVHGLDISPKMVERAQRNCVLCPNVSFSLGGIADLTGQPDEYDRILAYSVLQYLESEEAVFQAFQSLKKVMRPGGRALYSGNPDPAKKAIYLDRIIDKNMSESERDYAVQIVERTLWVSPQRMIKIAKETGLAAKCKEIGAGIWQHFYMFDLVLWHG